MDPLGRAGHTGYPGLLYADVWFILCLTPTVCLGLYQAVPRLLGMKG